MRQKIIRYENAVRFLPDIPTVTVYIHSKSGLEYYPLPENFTGDFHIIFNQGGVAKVKKGEDLK